MTESYLTTDIIVIIVLVVVLVLIGACAFFIHFYWTKIGVAEIWNTAKWSSMRSSFYQTVRRFSRASSSKYGSERPFSAASAYSEDTDGTALPAPLRNKKANTTTNPDAHPPQAQPSTTLKNASTHQYVRRNSSNQVQPVTTITYNQAVKTNHGTKVGQTPGNTRIQNVHENDLETHRF